MSHSKDDWTQRRTISSYSITDNPLLVQLPDIFISNNKWWQLFHVFFQSAGVGDGTFDAPSHG